MFNPSSSVYAVDDDDATRHLVCRELLQAGVPVIPCATVHELKVRRVRSGSLLVHDNNNSLDDMVKWTARSDSFIPLIAYGKNPDPRRVILALNAGAVDYLALPLHADDFFACLERVKSNWPEFAAGKWQKYHAANLIKNLSPRETAVLTQIADGLSTKEIAESLGLSPRTVEIHRGNAIKKLDARNSTVAAKVAWAAGLAS
uniref:response regulator transcription factor n=1 Tax=Parerythrobacter lutipelagi TaxID=1964208 RepID=UPI0010F78473|nr:response regulator transcription factor [Parerythrobacter lutipelagi]